MPVFMKVFNQAFLASVETNVSKKEHPPPETPHPGLGDMRGSQTNTPRTLVMRKPQEVIPSVPFLHTFALMAAKSEASPGFSFL